MGFEGVQRDLTVVLVEDNDLDVEKIERGFQRLDIELPLVRVRDGLEALDLMRGVDGTPPLTKPYVLLMDLNMPRTNGIELLAEIRGDSGLAETPVFVLTTSDRKQDVEQAYRHNVAGYFVKPPNRAEMTDLLERLNAYWQMTILPEGAR